MPKKINQHVFIAVIIYAFIGIVLIGLKSINEASSNYPRMLMYIMAVLNTFLLIDGISRSKTGSTEKQSAITWKETRNSIVTLLIVFAYVAAFQFLGYFIASAGVIVGLFLYYRIKSWKTIAIFTAGYLVFAYVVFVLLLKVRLL